MAPTCREAEVKDRVKGVFSKVLGVDSVVVGDDSSPATIPSWDSVNHLNLVMALEEEFRVSISTEEAMKMTDVGAILKTLRDHGAEP